MEIDLTDEASGWDVADKSGVDIAIPHEEADIDSELHKLYTAFDSMLEPTDDEPEEQEGGTDDGVHAPTLPRQTRTIIGGENLGGPRTAPSSAGLNDDQASATPPRPREHAEIPKYDLHGFSVLALVHENGVHGLGVNFCMCEGHAPEHQQLLMHGLFPASTKAPATAYDVNSLEKALVEESECHMPTESYWRKIKRFTVPDDPDATVNKYAITTRVHREFRAVQQYTEFGFSHQDPESRAPPGPASMAYPCISCPRNFNVPEDFENLPQDKKDLYFHAWTIDGNMKAEHTKSRRPGNNVQIFPGSGFLPEPDEFAKVVDAPFTDKDLPTEMTKDSDLCNHHTAAAGSGKADPSRDIRGILSICCARHGLMLPGGTVDIFFVENQAQADYALNRAMRFNLYPGISTRLILGYDIWCQYGVHLLERFARSPHLTFSEWVEELTGIVGAWHIFAHVRECFGRFSGLYVWGIGIIDMEILETLWSILNMITESCRNMSKANREETINFNMNEMNLKKIRNMTNSTVKKFNKKMAQRVERHALLETMNEICSEASRALWQEQLKVVYRKRAIDVQSPGRYDPKYMDDFLQSTFIAPDKSVVEAELLLRDRNESGQPGLVKFVANGLQLQIDQLSWQAFEKHNAPLSAVNQKKLLAARTNLKTRILKHNQLAEELLGRRLRDDAQPEGDVLFDTGVRFVPPQTSGLHHRTTSTRQSEFLAIDLPSARSMPLATAVLAQAGAYEIALRVAWMAHLLHEICLSLVLQVEIFRRTIKRTPRSRHMSQKAKADSAANMREQYQSVRVYARQYNVFRELMQGIRATQKYAPKHMEFSPAEAIARGKYKLLKAEDIRCDTTAYDTQGFGQFCLPWFWKLTRRNDDVSDENYIQDFFRMRWINAKAGVDRCDEEIAVLCAEMGMIHKGYIHFADEWAKRATVMGEVDGGDTHAESAWAKEEIWLEFAARAKEEFNNIAPGAVTYVRH